MANLLLLLLCADICACAQEVEKEFYNVGYRLPANETKWSGALAAIVKDVERLNLRGNPSLYSTFQNDAAMRAVFAANGFEGPKGTMILLLPEMGYFIVRSDLAFHQRLAHDLKLLKATK